MTEHQPEEPQSTARRSKTATTTSLRGRISGPIPIPGPLDPDFEKYNQNASSNPDIDNLAPMSTETKDLAYPTPREPSSNRRQRSATPPTVSDYHAQDVQGAQVSQNGQHPTGGGISLSTTNSTGHRKNNQSRNVRYSTFSVDSSSPNKNKPLRKTSTLRGAIGKLFGRKKKGVSQAPTSGSASTRQTPEEGNASAPETSRGVEQNRSTSSPYGEYRGTIRSNTASPRGRRTEEGVGKSLETELDNNFSRRRTGTHSYRGRQAEVGEMGGLTPRPASIPGRLSKLNQRDENPEEIGRALTSDFTNVGGLKRRSRSLSALVGLGNVFGDGQDTRTTEIRYWRASIDPEYKSPISSSHVEDQDVGTSPEKDDPVQEKTPSAPAPEPFVFPNLSALPEGSNSYFLGSDINDVKNMSGMKITPLASMGARIESMEKRMLRLETVVTQLCNRVPLLEPGQNSNSKESPLNVSGNLQYRDVLSDKGQSEHDQPSYESSSSRSSLYRNRKYGDLSSQDDKANRVSTATIRGTASLPSLSRDTPKTFTVDHYTTIMALLETERSARLALETKVRGLSHQVSLLAKRTENTSASGLGNSKPSFSSAFDHDDSEDEISVRGARTSLGPGNLGTIPGGGARDDSEDQTSSPTSYGADTDADDVAARKMAGRTMSLSQLTQNRNRPPPRPEQQPWSAQNPAAIT